MAIFWNAFTKTFAIFSAVLSIIVLVILLFSFIDNRNKDKFTVISGNKNSFNTIAVIELNGLIIENNREFSELGNLFSISPSDVKNHLNDLKKISPKVIIFSINSPGGTVSASKNLYEIINTFKKDTGIEILFHSNHLLASGAYWASTSADGIYASYGSVIGSIGVKGPDWFFYDQPKSISTGIFGYKIETRKEIKIFSSKAGKSKDIFNPFRKPTDNELNHLQNLVDEIYDDFVRIVSKERKIESDTITNNIGALIYNSKKAVKLNLIDGELSLDALINKKIHEKKFIKYKIIKKNIQKNSLFREILNSNLYTSRLIINTDCLSIRSSIVAIYNFESTGC